MLFRSLRLSKPLKDMYDGDPQIKKLIDTVEKNMRKAAADLNFEAAMELRDKMMELKKQLQEMTGGL